MFLMTAISYWVENNKLKRVMMVVAKVWSPHEHGFQIYKTLYSNIV